MSAAGDSGMLPAEVCLKEEQGWDGGILPAEVRLKEGQGSDVGMMPGEVRVKEEWEWDGTSEVAVASMYEELELKHELELGPERLQPQDIAYAIQQSSVRATLGNVEQELAAGDDTEAELSGEALSLGKSCREQFALKSCFVKLERISVDNEHTCLICHKTYLQKSSLITHMFTHDEETRSNVVMSKLSDHDKMMFSCDICGKCFTMKAQLIMHFLIHTGKKPYACLICDKQFSFKGNFTIHKQIHMVDKLYACEICNKQFICEFFLVKHMKMHTRDKPYKCEV